MKIIILLIAFLYTHHILATVITDWEAKTPCGNLSISQNYMEVGNEIFYVSKYFFYHCYMIGLTQDSRYFIINENKGAVEIFTQKEVWEENIKKKNLVPKYWTRWHQNGNHVFMTFEDLAIAVVFLPIPTLIFFSIIYLLLTLFVFLVQRKQRVSYKAILVKGLRFFAYLLLALFIFSFIYNSFPQSF